jgi:hypothetical protein
LNIFSNSFNASSVSQEIVHLALENHLHGYIGSYTGGQQRKKEKGKKEDVYGRR